MKLSIVIVSWNVQERLKANLEELSSSQVDFEYEIFVVDNNSADDTVEMVRQNFPQVKLIANDTNLGFAKANNIAIRSIGQRSEFILLLNPDMKVQNNTLQNSVDWMEQNKQASVAGFKLVSEQGGIIPHVRRFPGLIDQLAIVLKLPHLLPNVLDGYLCKSFDYDKAGRVDSIRGSFFLMRQSPDESSLLDERYFVWFEEVDFCRQMNALGREVWYSPAAACIDFVGGSFSQVGRGQTQVYFKNSMLAYFKKWHPAWQAIILQLAWPLGILLARFGGMIKFNSKTKT